jgi:hypothetical protein
LLVVLLKGVSRTWHLEAAASRTGLETLKTWPWSDASTGGLRGGVPFADSGLK